MSEQFQNTYVVDTDVFTRLRQELGNLGEEVANSCTYNYSYYTYNVCDGGVCWRDANCQSGCCNGSHCSSHWCSNNAPLAWLWWLLSFLILFVCISACIA